MDTNTHIVRQSVQMYVPNSTYNKHITVGIVQLLFLFL